MNMTPSAWQRSCWKSFQSVFYWSHFLHFQVFLHWRWVEAVLASKITHRQAVNVLVLSTLCACYHLQTIGSAGKLSSSVSASILYVVLQRWLIYLYSCMLLFALSIFCVNTLQGKSRLCPIVVLSQNLHLYRLCISHFTVYWAHLQKPHGTFWVEVSPELQHGQSTLCVKDAWWAIPH